MRIALILIMASGISMAADRSVFEWTAVVDPVDEERVSHAAPPHEVILLDRATVPDDSSAAYSLLHDHGILADDAAGPWSDQRAAALRDTLTAILDSGRMTVPRATMVPSRWTIVPGPVVDDIQILTGGAETEVRISNAAFSGAAPRPARLDGRDGTLHSRRLHHAVVRFLTDEGRDRDAVEQILNERYGVSTTIADHETLTRRTTRETSASFQSFHPQELLVVLEQLEELPPMLHRIPAPIHLARRIDGTLHPFYPQAPAVAWPGPEAGYIEFMEHAFTGAFLEQTQRLILHEKAHFLWARVLTESDRADWIALGEWNGGAGRWTTERTTEFASPFAHALNPNEDLAESVAYFVLNPDKLRTRAPSKYAFVRDVVMGGNVYLSWFREDLTFSVQNSDPDNVYPGRLRAVTVTVDGAPRDDKTITVELELNTYGPRDFARKARMRLRSDVGTYVDVRMRPVDIDGLQVESGARLRGRFELSRHARGGSWRPGQIVLTDSTGNQRFEATANRGWTLYIDNPLEDLVAPKYVARSAELTLSSDPSTFGRPVQIVTATWGVAENTMMAGDRRACHASLVNREAGTYSFTQHGKFNPQLERCSTRFVLTEHAADGVYVLASIGMGDAARNHRTVRFIEGQGESPAAIHVETSAPDTTRPVLDVGGMRLSAQPSRPGATDGETSLRIEYTASDDRAGLGQVALTVRDPSGGEHHFYHYHANFHGPTFDGDPTEQRHYTFETTLPAGSPPGTWGLSSMQLRDKVNNIGNHDFTETLRFEVE